MRLSTKIVLGIILSLLLLSLGFIIGFSFTDRVNYKWDSNDHIKNIPQENMTLVEVNPYRTVLLEMKEGNNEYNVYPQGSLYVGPVTETEKHNHLYMPEELLEYTEIVSQNDTLIIRVKMKNLNDKYYTNEDNRKGRIFTQISGFNFYIYTTDVDAINNGLSRINIDVKEIENNSIKIHSVCDIFIHKCKTKVIEPSGNGHICKITESKTQELNIDLDNISTNWIVENCEIDVENLTGSQKSNVQLSKNEAKVMNWIPKTKEAGLNVTLYGDTTKVVFQ